MQLANYLYGVPLATVLVGWVAFALIFVLRKRPSGGGKVGKRDPASVIGIVLVMAGFCAVGSLGRRPLTPIVPMPLALWGVTALAIVLLVPASLWLVRAAVRTLGKQWSVQARVLEGHALVTTGPYRLVRHPIYTAVIVVVIAMGLAYSSLVGLLIGIVLVTVGTLIRIRAEERLLRERFGAAYADYARRVPALLPVPWRRWTSQTTA
jgi:protein-S-isoprenylcysteine O-methyltransferase Ste14